MSIFEGEPLLFSYHKEDTMAKNELLYPKNVGEKVAMDFTMAFWSYQLNSTADLADLAQF